MQRVYQKTSAVFAVCFCLIVAALFLRNGVLLAVGAAALCVFLLQKHPILHFTLLLLVGGFLLRLAVILLLRPPAESDFATLFDAARGLLNGDLSFSRTDYFTLWAYQTAYVCWEALWLSIWNSAMCLKLVHILLSAGTVCLLYRMLLPHVRKPAAQASAVLLTVFPFALTLPTILTNQIPAAFFVALGLWLLICPDADRLRFWRYPLSGAALQIGNLLRPEGIVVLVAVAAWGVFSLLRAPKRRLVCGLLALLAVYFALGFGADRAVRASGLNANGLSNQLPEWKFVCGTNYETDGKYSAEDWSRIKATLDENFLPTDETDEVCRELISQHLNPAGLAQFLLRKLDALWGGSRLSMMFRVPLQTAGHLKQELYHILDSFDHALFLVALVLAALGLRKAGTPDAHLPYFVFFAAFCAFLPIEVQPRYAYLPQLFLFAAAAFGIDQCMDWREAKCRPSSI